MYFKYYFPCTKQELTVGGQMELLDLDALGEARVAMQDCTKVGYQCMLSDLGLHCPHGPGAMLDPFPAEGERPSFGDPLPMGETDWQWLDFSWKGDRTGKIGYRLSNLPTPDYLRRREQIDGYYVTDAHEQKWAIPTARNGKGEFGKLPTFIVPMENDEWIRRLDERWLWLWELSQQVWEALDCFYSKGNRPEYEFPWFPQQAARIISVNYRVGQPELRALAHMGRSILSDDFCRKTGEALCNHDVLPEFFLRREKEKLAATAKQEVEAAAKA